jgi:hypothetical protein
MNIRTRFPTPLLLVAGLLVGCADDAPTSPGDPGALDVPEVAYAQGPNARGVILDIDFPDQLCGIPVVISYRRTGADFGDVFGQPAVSSGQLEIIYTNPENGNSVTYRGTGHVVRELLDQGVDDQGDTWIEVRETVSGIRGKIGATGGPVRGISAGKLVVELRVTFVAGGAPIVEVLDVPVLTGPDDPETFRESPEQCAVVEDILL